MPGRVDLGATAAAAADRTISTLSGSLNTAGDAARNAGAVVRDRLRDSARAVERGGKALRDNGVKGAATAAVDGARRHKKTLLGSVGAVAGGLLTLGLVRRARNRNGRFRWPWKR